MSAKHTWKARPFCGALFLRSSSPGARVHYNTPSLLITNTYPWEAHATEIYPDTSFRDQSDPEDLGRLDLKSALINHSPVLRSE